jgi:prepilin-type processing-associated H-X9-DG protein
MAILLPSLSAAKRHVQRIVCASNIKGIMTACFGYMSENDGIFPEQNAFRPTNYMNPDLRHHFGDVGRGLTHPDPVYYSWAYRIDPYMNWKTHNDSKYCPRVKANYTGQFSNDDMVRLSYFANSVLATFGGRRVRQPAHMIAITETFAPAFTVRTFPRLKKYSSASFDWEHPRPNEVYGYNWMTDFEGVLWAHRPHKGRGENNGGRNYGFLDGHVEFYDWQDVKCGMFGLSINGDTNAQEPIGAGGSRNPERMGDIVF